MPLSRRTFLAASAATPALAAAPAFAGGHASAPDPLNARAFQVGDAMVTTLLAGGGMQQDPQSTFGMNVDAETFQQVSAENFISAESWQGYFTPVLVELGEDVILFDTGLPGGGVVSALEDAGKAPGDITHVVITHMHPDHIGGLMTDGAPTFENAAVIAGEVEYNAWAGTDNRIGQMVAQMVDPLSDRLTLIADGADVRPGLTAMMAAGHTPGLLLFTVDGGGSEQILLASDLANHHVWSLARPDWEVRFDMDKAAAAASRRRVLGMMAEERMAMAGYHMPFPGVGFVEADGDNFKWVPHTYQFTA
ncbi:MAG: MBL fold metallo-hydrolase [Shimia sp.]